MLNRKFNIESGILGLVVGDALGVPHEFNPRVHFDKEPVTDMVGYGTHSQPAGTWSDDSSLVLATLDSLSNGLNYKDMMDKFLLWCDNGDYTPYGVTFDIGGTTGVAISRYGSENTTFPYGLDGERDNGNGSLMRILPVAFFIYYLKEKLSISDEEEFSIIHNVSALTHAHKRSMLGCGIYIKIAIQILKYKDDLANGGDIQSLESLINKGITDAKEYYFANEEFKHQKDHYTYVFDNLIKDLGRDDIRGSGYVVRSLIASIWCLLHTNSYKEAVLEAVNLGEDTDTTAAIVGGIAGLYYGLEDIPKDWLDKIAKLDYIKELITNFDNFVSKELE